MTKTRPKVMIIDDEPGNLRMAAEILKKYVDTALSPSGEQALQYLSANNDIDLILLDINMPGMDGFEVLNHLKEKQRTADIPVAFLTGQQEVEKVEKGIKGGAVGYILKPYNKEALLDRLVSYLTASIKKIIAKQCDVEAAVTVKDGIILNTVANIDTVVAMALDLPSKES